MARIHSTDQPHGLKGVPSGGPQPVEDDGDQQISWLLQRSRPAAERPHHYLLLLRFTLFNMVAFALLGAAWVQGWIEAVLAADRSFLCLAIFGVFLAGLAACSWRVWQTSRDLNQVKSFDPLTSSVTASYFANSGLAASGPLHGGLLIELLAHGQHLQRFLRGVLDVAAGQSVSVGQVPYPGVLSTQAVGQVHAPDCCPGCGIGQ